jgi:1-acyl-sn-glycerol-3-phosphate acyltransferase
MPTKNNVAPETRLGPTSDSPRAVVRDGRREIGRLLVSLVVDAAIVLYTLVIGSAVIVAAAVSQRAVDWLGALWCRLIVWTCAARIEVVGLERLPRGRSYVLVANHQSNFDIWALVSVLRMPPRFIAKHELLRLPVFGWALRVSGQIVIDRADPESAKVAINRATRALPEGMCLCFFAEGTRSADGRIGAFKKGAVALALMTGLPLVPVSISGTRKFLPKRGRLVRPGGRVRIVFGEPVETAGLTLEARDELNERMREQVYAAFDPDL